MDTAKRETMTEFAERAMQGFKVEPYEVVDKALREGVREAVESYKAHTEKALDFMEDSLNGG